MEHAHAHISPTFCLREEKKMGRNPELDKLLREVDSLTSATPQQEPVEEQPSQAKSESSFLKSIGSFFISKVDEEEAQQELPDGPPPPTPHTAVADVAATMPTPDFSAVAESDDDLSKRSFETIYSEAGIDESVFTVDKLAALLQDPTLKDQPMSTKTLVLKMALKAQNVSPEIPVTDAVQRDRALDGYQKMLNQRASETERQNAALIQRINDEVKAFLEQKNAEMDALRTETQEMKRQAESFAVRRHEEEKRLADLVVPLLEGQPNPVSVNNKVD
jgi:hypothetical protein